MSDSRGVIYVGIDLGTSRSAVSVSNGERHMIESYVGWPIDLIARKLLKKEVLVGHEAVEKRTMLDLRRPLERGLIKEGSEKDELAVHELLRHLIALGGLAPTGEAAPVVHAVVGVPAEALRVNRLHLRHAMEGIADSLMIVSEPFAVAYGEEALMHSMIIDIGAGTTDFCVMQGHYPTEDEQRTLEIGGDTIDAQLAILVHERYPDTQFSEHMVRTWKEQRGFVTQPKSKQRIMVDVAQQGKPISIDVTKEMGIACKSIVPPVAETMLDLVSRVEPEFQQQVRRNIILAGGCSRIHGLADSLEKALDEVGGGKVRLVSDPTFAGSDGGLSIALDAQDDDWEKLAL